MAGCSGNPSCMSIHAEGWNGSPLVLNRDLLAQILMTSFSTLFCDLEPHLQGWGVTARLGGYGSVGCRGYSPPAGA